MPTSSRKKSVSSTNGVLPVTMPNSPPDNGNGSSEPTEENSTELVDRGTLVDEGSPVDRRILNDVFQAVYFRYSLDQTKLAESCGVSTTTISMIVNRGELVTWNTWQLIIAGLIKFKITHAYTFWVNLPPSTRTIIRENTGNPVILQYIAEYDKFAAKNEEEIVKNVNTLLGHLDPERINEELLDKIVLPTEGKTTAHALRNNLLPAAEANQGRSQVTNGSANFCYNGDIGHLTLIVFPPGIDEKSPQVSELVNNVIKNAGANVSSKDDEPASSKPVD
jgi:plasmid maintenance system antidote protein VapI